MDVFHCDTPDAFHAKTDKDMMDKHLHKWQQSRETNVAFHSQVPTMICYAEAMLFVLECAKECDATARCLGLHPFSRRLPIARESLS